MSWFKSLLRHREWLLLPLFIGVMALLAQVVWWISGRAPTDDPGEIVGACYRAARLAMAVALTGYVQDHHFGYRSLGDSPRLRDDVYDACVTYGLLLLFVWALWH